jgi:hypothetical protein
MYVGIENLAIVTQLFMRFYKICYTCEQLRKMEANIYP